MTVIKISKSKGSHVDCFFYHKHIILDPIEIENDCSSLGSLLLSIQKKMGEDLFLVVEDFFKEEFFQVGGVLVHKSVYELYKDFLKTNKKKINEDIILFNKLHSLLTLWPISRYLFEYELHNLAFKENIVESNFIEDNKNAHICSFLARIPQIRMMLSKDIEETLMKKKSRYLDLKKIVTELDSNVLWSIPLCFKSSYILNKFEDEMLDNLIISAINRTNANKRILNDYIDDNENINKFTSLILTFYDEVLNMLVEAKSK